jgi:hypothetical protein
MINNPILSVLPSAKSARDVRRGQWFSRARSNFITEIDRLDIHFIHVRSPHEETLPIVITHGWW